MERARTERRLAAIFAADMVGYSRLMEVDESGTLERLKTLRIELIDPAIANHNGRIFKTTGDGLLVEFASVVDAVQCAVEIQRDMARRNSVAPADRHIEYRIGINLGDIIVENEDVYGGGVNIAARLEALAKPGGICISGTAYDHLTTKIDVGYEYLGEQQVKNIAEPVRTYWVLLEGSPAETAMAMIGMPRRRWWAAAALGVILAVGGGAAVYDDSLRQLIGIPAGITNEPRRLSIVVLPFANLSGDESQEHLADGITEDVITDLSRITGSFVVASNTSFTYKGAPVDVKQVAAELGVRNVLEGSIRRSGDQIRVNVQLIDGETGSHIWADRFDRELGDVFSLQNEVTGRIASVLRLELVEAESRRLLQVSSENYEALDYALRGWAELWTKAVTRDSILEAKRLLEGALELDPNSAFAWTGMARVHYAGVVFGWGSTSKEESLRLFLESAQRAVALDPKYSNAHAQLGYAYRFHLQPENAASACQTALDLNPNNDDAYLCLGLVMVALGRPTEAIPLFDTSFRLNPRSGNPARRYFFTGFAQLVAGDHEEAVATAQKGIVANPQFASDYYIIASGLAWLGREEEAKAALASLPERIDTIEEMREHISYMSPDYEHVLEGLRKAGMPEE